MHLNSGPPYPTKKNKPVALPSREEIERVAYCVGVYLSAFSKEPFDEKWSVDELKVPGFLLNPRSTAHFVKELFSQERPAISATSDGGEQAIVSKGLLLKHLEETLSDPMTGFLCDTEWFTKTDIEGLHELIEALTKSKKELFNLHMPYPVNSVIASYVKAMRDPVSMVLLGYQNGSAFNPSSKINYLRIENSTLTPSGIYPRVVCRYITANSPKQSMLNRQNVHDFVLDEVGYYLTEEQQLLVKSKIDPDLYTTFFGELAKIPGSDRSIKALPFVGAKYIEIITNQADGVKDFDFLELISDQLVYLSVKGTTVLLDSNKEKGSTKLFEGVMGLLGSLGLKYKEDVLLFNNSKNQEVAIGVIKQI